MIGLGFGEVIGGFTHGLLIDKLGSKKTVFLNLFYVCVMISTALASISYGKFNALSFAMCFSWGWTDGIMNTWLF